MAATSHARSWQQNYESHAQQPQKKQVVIKKSGWITHGEKVLYSIAGICLIIAAVFVVSFSSQTDTLNRNLQDLEQKVQKQELKNAGLADEVKELSRPERIIKIAKENGLKVQEAKVKQARNFGN
ncbi:cell division protein FtsL [Virgibacillus sp. 179-BFC.A HS]|uniref:Cell division protein FtsL n=1 Tax=Tigheibacillus jepli TaxID=3035914 RepID=A0ABU5CI16_9BACI|nr:cell division protein FtsL [Virgibacillus sp. 179-BFC.A HS]MDY0405969.1 cell division protein FtsL [Virgibacillus sp. 179-BFC.A HS]